MSEKETVESAKGKVKETVGKVTGDSQKKAEGLLDQVVGKTKEVASNVKETAEGLVEEVKDKLDK